MYEVGQEEIDAIARVIRANALFRYGVGSECERFEERYANYLGVKHFALAASGSNALAAAMTAVGLGPGDEIIIPAHTYMATATSVLSVGAMPLIVDIDETITIDPKAIEAAIGPRTRAVVRRSYVGRRLRHGGDHVDCSSGMTCLSSRTHAKASAAATKAASSAASGISAPSVSTITRT